ncbi:MAG: glycosyltransferase family 9 protein, partial [Bacteroidetes bacterium]|nr:glycosyltransferase family 9 protein [Bacteroidota bacterium]
EVLTQNNYATVSPVPVLKRNFDKNEIKKSLGLEKYKTVIGLFPFGGVNPGTKMRIKRWDVSNYLRLAEMLSEKTETGIVLFEGREEDEKYPAGINLKSNYRVRTIDFNLIPACGVFISADTGPLHIAAALGVPTVGLFGPSDPLLVAPPDGDGRNVFIRQELPCSPCYTPSSAVDRKNREYWNGDNFICRLGTGECMKSITVDEVFKETVKILNNTQ